jgi:glycolate oxidase iron-sulfur subunit
VFVKRNIDAWTKSIERAEAEGAPVTAVIINASGCGTTVKDYGHMLQHDPAYAAKAARISSLTRDVTEFLGSYELGPPKRWSSLRVAYHSACSMQHGQQIIDPPKKLLRDAGFTVMDVPEGHICCGSAGVYNILQPELAGQLRERKVANILSVKPDLVAAGNIGCITQIGLGMDTPIVHTIELLDWAYGGPSPRGLESYERFVKDVPASTLDVADYITP